MRKKCSDRGIRRRRQLECGEALVLAADLRAKLLPELVGDLEKHFDDCGVELRSRTAQYLFAGRVKAARPAVGAITRDGIECVCHGKDARANGNLAAANATWIAFAVIVRS